MVHGEKRDARSMHRIAGKREDGVDKRRDERMGGCENGFVDGEMKWERKWMKEIEWILDKENLTGEEQESKC